MLSTTYWNFGFNLDNMMGLVRIQTSFCYPLRWLIGFVSMMDNDCSGVPSDFYMYLIQSWSWCSFLVLINVSQESLKTVRLVSTLSWLTPSVSSNSLLVSTRWTLLSPPTLRPGLRRSRRRSRASSRKLGTTLLRFRLSPSLVGMGITCWRPPRTWAGKLKKIFHKSVIL